MGFGAATEEEFPNERWHARSPASEALETSIALALDPSPLGGYAALERVALRASLAFDRVFAWWCFGDVLGQYKVFVVAADEPAGFVLGPESDEMFPPGGPRPPAPPKSPSVTGRYYNWLINGEGGAGLSPGRYWVMGTVNGRRSAPIPFRIKRPEVGPDDRKHLLDEAGTTSVSLELRGAGPFAVGAPIVVRGRVDAGAGLFLRTRGFAASHVQILVVRVTAPFEPPEDWVEDVPAPGTMVNDADATIVRVTEAAGVKVSESRFEVDLAEAAGLERRGRYWVMATVDGALSEAVELEIV